jgi:acyl-CoA thioesterase I
VKLRITLALLAGLTALGLAAPAQALDAGKCNKVARLAEGSGNLTQMTHRPDTTIVAVGSSSTQGIASNDAAMLYPAAMERSLREQISGIKVVNKGIGGENLMQTIARFDADVLALKPALVVWQLGVNDVLQLDGVEDRRRVITDGLKKLTDAGVPVVLLDLQYAPRVNNDADTGAMQAMIESAARQGPHGRVHHFRRYEAMKRLAEQENVPMAEMIVADGLHMTDKMHACIGRLLAGQVAKVFVAGPTAASVAAAR